MSFMEHLGELRTRIVRGLVALLVGLLITLPFSDKIVDFLARPIKKMGHTLIFTSPTEAFWVQMKVALIAGLFLASPGILWQVWRFVEPGLHLHEKKYAVPFIAVGSLLFIGGGAFSLFVVTPYALNFLLSYARPGLTPMITLQNHVDFMLKFTVAFGAVFELPLVITLLARMGVVNVRMLARNRKYAILGAFIVAAVLTPTPDIFNQTLMAGPLILLYEVGILERAHLRAPPGSGAAAGLVERPAPGRRPGAGSPPGRGRPDDGLIVMDFAALDLPEPVMQGIRQAGFMTATPIQEAALPLALRGKDVAGQSQTGTGKTAAFLIAGFTRLLRSPEPAPGSGTAPRMLIIAPTRELVVQIEADAQLLGALTPFRILAVYGGIDYARQRDALAAGADVLVGTPGRLIDYLKQHIWSPRRVEVLVVDEADRMFDMGFIADLRFLLRRLPSPRSASRSSSPPHCPSASWS